MNNKEIEKLCNDICSNLQNGSTTDENKSLRLFRNLCGLRMCACSILTPPQSLSCLLKVLYLSESVVSFTIGLSIINNYDALGHEDHCIKVLEKILTHTITTGHSEEKNMFLRELWNYPGLKNFTISTVEDLISHQRHFLEEDILEVFEESVRNKLQPRVLEDMKYERAVMWSANSPRIFCTVTSIFNALLQRVASSFGLYKLSVNVISHYISKVKIKCVENKKDFVLLYPYEFHSLVSVLDINPDCFPKSSADKASVNISTVVELVKQSMASKPAQTLCILTHFPDWFPYINR